MHPRHLYSLLTLGQPRSSPDKSRIAFTVSRPREESNDYETAVRIMPIEERAHERQITVGGDREDWPCWNPIGRALAITSNVGCSAPGLSRIWIVPLEAGAPCALTPPMRQIRDLAWSPTGNEIAFTSHGSRTEQIDAGGIRRVVDLAYRSEREGWRGDQNRHIYIAQCSPPYELFQLSEGPYEHYGISWCPTTDTLVTVSARHDFRDGDKVTHLFAFDRVSRSHRQLTTDRGQCLTPVWSPTGDGIALFYNASAYYSPTHWQLAWLNMALSEPTLQTLTDQEQFQCRPVAEHQPPIWTTDAKIVVAVEHRGRTRLLKVDPYASAPLPVCILEAEGIVSAFDQGPADHPVVVMSTNDQPEELWLATRALTALSHPLCDAAQPQGAQPFIVESRDGARIDAWIIRPRGLRPGEQAPALICIHGGPFSQYGNRFLDEFQAYSHAGFAVIYSNPRGSSGYGQAWGRAIVSPRLGGAGFGSVDLHDVLAVCDAALQRFAYIDPERWGLIGGSYGGTLAAHILSRTTRFLAACIERGASDFRSLFGTSDFGVDFTTYFGAPDDDAWWQSSPLNVVEHIRTPLLIIHCEDDIRVPISQSEQLFAALRARRRVVEMLRFPAGGHEISRSGPPRLRVARLENIIAWFKRWL
jgi:dipeptidyl aminopeptidase/acylaminoacyl peptidase